MSKWLKIGGAVALASLAIEAAFVFPLSQWISGLLEWLRGAGLAGAALYAGVYITAAVLMLPGSVLTLGAGFAYGPWWGTALVSPVSVAAATVACVLGRTVARGWVSRRTAASPKFRSVDAAVRHHGLRIVILLRLSPVLPFNVLNYALGLTSVRLRDYVLGSFVGMLPATFLYVYLGSLIGDVAALSTGTAEGTTAGRVLSVLGLVATVVVVIFVTRIARRALDEALAVPVAMPDAPLQKPWA